jgi:hypothetical protein
MSKNSGDVIEVVRTRVRQRDPLLGWLLNKAAIEDQGNDLYITVLRPLDFTFASSRKQCLEEIASEVCGRSIRVIIRGPDELKNDASPVVAEPVADETRANAAQPSREKSLALTNGGVPPAQPIRAARRRAQHDREKIEQTLHRFCRNGGAVEIRALNCQPGNFTTIGYFDEEHLSEAARLATKIDASGIYFTLNPVKADLLARAANRLQPRPKFSGTSDGDIDRREWLFLDFDPVRPSGISATDEEKSLAFQRAEGCRQFLADRGWPVPLAADSGNGMHLDYPIALPNKDESRVLIERVLKSLALTFTDDKVALDVTTGNAARIIKLYGTVAAKGDDTPTRPHRVSAILEDSGLRPGEVVSGQQLSAVAALLPEESARASVADVNGKEFVLDNWIRDHNPPVRGPYSYGNDLKWLGLYGQPCLFGGVHDSGAFFLIKRVSGPIQAGCHHDSCHGKSWRDLRLHYEPDAYTRRIEHASGVPTVASLNQSQSSNTADAFVLPEVFIRNKIQVLDWRELGERRRTHVQNWVVNGWLARGEISTWWGKVEHGKTTVMRELAMCVIRGEQFLGHECPAGRVFYAMLDADSEDLTYDEFEKMGMNDSDLPNIKFMFEPMLARMENGHEQFFRELYEWRPDMVIIDPFARLKEVADFNDYSNTYLMAMLSQYSKVLAAHFALPGHIPRGRPPGAAAATAGQGSIAFGAGANARFVVERKEGTDIYVLRTSKGKSAGFEALEGDHVLELNPSTGRLSLGKAFTFGQQARAFKEPVFEFLENNPGQEWSAAAIAKEIHTTTGTARLAANMLYEDGRADRSGTGKRGSPFQFAKKGVPKADDSVLQRRIFEN